MEFLVLVLCMVTLLFIYKLYRLNHTNGITLPGPKGWPFVGSALDISIANSGGKLRGLAKKYGSIFHLKMFNVDIVCLNSAEVIRKAFGENPYQTVMSNRSRYFYAERFLHGSQSVIFARDGHGSMHNEMRKGVVKAFHVYGEGRKNFEDNVHTELGRLTGEIDRLDGKGFDFEATFKKSLSNLISILLSGKEIDEEHANLFWELDRAVDFFVNPIVDILMLTFPFLEHIPGRFRTSCLDVANAKEKIKVHYVDKQIETYEPGKVRGIVDSLIAQRADDEMAGREVTFTYERIVSMTVETIVAGVLTTLSTLSNLMLCLLHHPECQKKIQEEVDAVVGRDRRPNISDRANCPFTEAVIMESIRCITPVPLLAPHECAEDIQFEGHTIRKGNLLFGNVDFVHHDEKIWEDPWTFRPERFLDDSGQLLHRDHESMKNWLPFSYGRRQCIGEGLARSRLFLYIAILFQRYTFEPVDGKIGSYDIRHEEDFEMNATIRPKPFSCRAVRRIK